MHTHNPYVYVHGCMCDEEIKLQSCKDFRTFITPYHLFTVFTTSYCYFSHGNYKSYSCGFSRYHSLSHYLPTLFPHKHTHTKRDTHTDTHTQTHIHSQSHYLITNRIKYTTIDFVNSSGKTTLRRTTTLLNN